NSDAVLKYLHQQLGLLADFGERHYDFTHLTFREYFLAHYLYGCWWKNPKVTWQLLSPIRHYSEMREPILFLAGLLGREVNGATRLIHSLREAIPLPRNFPVRIFPKASLFGRLVLHWFPDWQRTERLEGYLRRDLLLATYCLAETQSNGVDKKETQNLVDDLIDLWHANPFDRQRSEILNAMKAIKDDANRQRIVAALIQDLSDRSYRVRWPAAYALGEIGEATPSVIDALVHALSDKQTKVRVFRWGNRPWHLPLIWGRDDVGIWVRQNAAYSLGRLGKADPKVITALARTMKEDNRLSVNNTAASSLARLSAVTPQIISILIEALHSEPPSQITSQDVEPYLSRAYLKRYRTHFPPDLEIPPSAFAASELNRQAQLAHQQAREVATYGLNQLDHASQEVIDILIEALEDEDPFVRQSVALGLARLNQVDSRVIEALVSGIKQLTSEEAKSLARLAQTNRQALVALTNAARDIFKRSAVFYAIGQLDQASAETIAILVDAFDGPFDGHQDEAAKALGKLGQATPEVIKALVGALYVDYDPGGFIHQAATVSLGQLAYASDEVIDALIHAMEIGFGEATCSLGQLNARTEKALTALKKALTHRLRGVRNAAAISLVQLGQDTPEIISTLIDILKDDSETWWESKIGAAHSLGLLAEEASHEVLEALAYALQQRDNDHRVFPAVSDSLAQLSKFHRDSVINILLEILADPRLDRLSSSGLGGTIHNYAYDALWIVMGSSPIQRTTQ
ncbi:MAG: HEAT repeat domain-containing protein, partial [Nitrososphaera sp.]|nr:HEAT repeat domain-containing protein [Nitrososphaera sp.]